MTYKSADDINREAQTKREAAFKEASYLAAVAEKIITELILAKTLKNTNG